MDKLLTQPLESMSKARRPSTPSPSGRESTKKPRTGDTWLRTPDPPYQTSAGKKTSQSESLQTPEVSSFSVRRRDTTPPKFSLGPSGLPTPTTGNSGTRQERYERELQATPTKSRVILGATLNADREDEESDSYGCDEDLETGFLTLAYEF
jgi:hypothetical protein